MLVLSRQRDERILAGLVEITVVDIRGDKVRLGVGAPRSIPVHRQEVLMAINHEDPAKLHRLGYELNDSGLVVPRRDLLAAFQPKGNP